VIQSESKILALIEKDKSFSLSHLAHSQMQTAKEIYQFEIPQMEIESQNQVPYMKGANAVLLCRLEKTVDLGGNTLIVGRVYEVIMAETPGKPLVNYKKDYCSVDDDRTPVYSNKVVNPRLCDGQPPVP
jgi:flavin reductase (DIM6/NTAB) family NADH-FMN oxidoreductase RutF